MKIEKLELSNKKIKYIAIGFIMCAVIFILINYLTSRANYRNTESIELAKGTINYSLADLNVIAMYKIEDGRDVDIDTVPTEGYTLSERSYCTTPDSDAQIKDVFTFDYYTKELNIKVTKKGTKCYLYFEEAKPVEKMLAKLKINTSSIKNSPDLSKTACDTGCGTDEKGIYEAKDDYGTSYYYRGTVNNNWVKFGNYWWRIIRINGNGTVRMIYSGTNNAGDQPTDGYLTPKDNSQTGISKYNSSSNDNAYVGFKYGTVGAINYTDAHINTTDSTILGVLRTWYNGASSLNKSLIDGETGFCNDRTPYDKAVKDATLNKESYGFGKLATYYGTYIRTWTGPREASLECPQASQDLFTTGGTKGNGALDIPVGLITTDELILAGGYAGGENKRFWLYTGNYYWTMSPSHLDSNSMAYVFIVYNSGVLSGVFVDNAITGVRPVINLKASTNFSGTGTVGDPYIPS